MTLDQVRSAVRAISPAKDFVWNGVDEDDRPATREELRAGIEAARKRGRPSGSTKEATTIRIDADVLAALKATGPGWQTRVNELLRAAVGLRGEST